MRRLAALVALAAGCTTPNYGSGHLQCAPTGECPSGFYCAGDLHCWRTGSGPSGGNNDLATPAVGDLGSQPGDLGSASDLGSSPSTCGSLMGVLFCDGFEGPLLTSGWSGSGSNGLPTRDTSRAFRGAASLHAHIDGASAMTSPFAALHRSDLFPIAGTIYARVWVYFTSGLPVNFEQFLNFADNSMTGYSLATDHGKVTLDDYAAGVYQSSATAMPLDRWACVQFEVQQGNPMAAIRVSVDGQVLSDLPQTAAATVAVNMSLGLDFYNNAAAIPQYDAWFDELIIDTKPTTCNE